MDEVRYASMVVKHAGTEVKHKDTVGVTSTYTGVAAPDGNAFVDPRRLDKAFFFMRNGQKVYHIHLYQHKKQVCKSLINRVKSNEI